jgi:hypothetical protein
MTTASYNIINRESTVLTELSDKFHTSVTLEVILKNILPNPCFEPSLCVWMSEAQSFKKLFKRR